MKNRSTLVFVALSAAVVMFVGIQNLLIRPWAFTVLAVATLYPIIVARSVAIAGLTRRNLAQALIGGVGAGVVYGTIRGLALAYIRNTDVVFGADLMRMVPIADTGIHLGGTTISGSVMWLFLLMLLPIGFAGIELFFRGIVFLRVREWVHWTGAVAIASIAQAVARRTPHSLIMGSLAGVLMQKYENIAAPIVMHGTQFLVALAIVLATR